MAEHKFYLTVGSCENHPGKLLAICTRGQPQLSDETIEVLTLELVDSHEEAHEWYKRVLIEQP